MRKQGNTDLQTGLISVIFPIYGTFDQNRLLLAIQSAQNQREVDVEIIVSEHGDTPKLQSKLDSSVKYIFTKHLIKKGANNFNPGKIRNDGVNISHGEYVYTNDSDVIFMNPLFLWNCKRLLEKDEKLSLFRPRMRRLPIEDFETFLLRIHCILLRNAFSI
ncbi:MAG: hypothetical protein US31_C0030G0005 [Berkelbacteria bacterium GW2011_GWA1_36_9]|uniref:Glycosyltransferase 2-like domain-containing protein n=1 Tax=Berkelbacteria bacterium GW2011_GWA1_36_9 TaxID=1618331 RepID=A0A0G0IKJ8_9BACT|nr:MAG: hypothetical protein US31_C0030G0005 [Berkelbacteria bacterium GW2011_GWA1_36_9]